jgi:succinoglycan biosynthesis transport protein ExoP
MALDMPYKHNQLPSPLLMTSILTDESSRAANSCSPAAPRNGPGSDAPPLDCLTLTPHANGRLLTQNLDPLIVESYQRLGTKLLQLRAVRPFRSLVVTSPSPQEGKTLTSINLGLTLASVSPLRILLVDGDLRRGSLGRFLDGDGRPGLSNLLDGSAGLESVIFKTKDSRVNFLLRGTSNSSTAELLHSVQLKAYFAELSEKFDIVIVDSPPVNLLSDVQLIAASCDVVLLVSRAFSTTRRALESATRDLAPFEVIGAVLNGGSPMRGYKKYSHYYYHDKK